MKKAIAAYALVIILYTALILAMTGCEIECRDYPDASDSTTIIVDTTDDTDRPAPTTLVLDSAEMQVFLNPTPVVTGINRSYTAEEAEEYWNRNK